MVLEKDTEIKNYVSFIEDFDDVWICGGCV
jgi:hypothetical protein